MPLTQIARYSGHCRTCEERIAPGDSIRPTRTGLGWNHATCPAYMITPPRHLRAVRAQMATYADSEEARASFFAGVAL